MKIFPEWREHKGTLLSWPQRNDLWNGKTEYIEKLWVHITSLLSRHEEVHILLHKKEKENQIKEAYLRIDQDTKLDNIIFHNIPTDDVWVRDYAPIFLDNKEALIFKFDAWRRQFTPYKEDDLSGLRIVNALGWKPIQKDYVLEGGSIDTDGHLLLATLPSIVSRFPCFSKNKYEKLLKKTLKIDTIIWLHAGLPGDHTDGHVDTLSRFFEKGKIITCVCHKKHPAYHNLWENYKILEQEAKKLNLEIQDLVLPPQKQNLPRSYANFYIANKQILVPVYNEKTDDLALQQIQTCFPEHSIEGIDASLLIEEGGAIHCITMQIPK